ncbi:MAG: very short patch repair endonuclease [Treponema sp.]|nr:very short patch repair endonuclease [Treponema sp.]
MDSFSPERRHYIMSQIRSKDTKPEKQIRSALFKAGFRFRICDKRYPGKPDLIFPRYYAVIFINGCFWHAHEKCRLFDFPKSNKPYWQKKFARNKERDAQNLKYYQDQCWRVCFVWECAIRGKNSRQKIENVKDRIIQWLEEPDEAFLELRGPVVEKE